MSTAVHVPLLIRLPDEEVLMDTSSFTDGLYDGRFMSCEEKTRLTARYEAATTKFCEAVTELNQKMGTSAKTEYDRLARVANELRLKSEQARLALEEHLGAHRC